MRNKYDEALTTFLEFVGGFHVKTLTLLWVAIHKAEKLLNLWKVDHIELHTVSTPIEEFLELDTMKVGGFLPLI